MLVIAAPAVCLELPLITADKKIQKVTGLEVIEYHLSAGV